MSQDKTQHGLKTFFGLKTPHKLPSKIDNSDEQESFNQLNNLVDSLYPTGRAWYAPEGGVFKNLHEGINTSFLRLIIEYQNLINKSIPDNENFTLKDAEFLEFKYGLTTYDAPVSSFTTIDQSFLVDQERNNVLEQRKSALRRKIGHPNNLKERQSKNFIEDQLQLAGFNVRVFENTFPYFTPSEIAKLILNDTQHGGDTQHADNTYHGGVTFEVIANKIDPDESYGVGDNLWSSFFIGGETLGEVATVPQYRQREFRELVLKLKPAHLAAYIFINFV